MEPGQLRRNLTSGREHVESQMRSLSYHPPRVGSVNHTFSIWLLWGIAYVHNLKLCSEVAQHLEILPRSETMSEKRLVTIRHPNESRRLGEISLSTW